MTSEGPTKPTPAVTPERIAELRRLLAAGTPRPWFAHVNDDGPLCESAAYVGTGRLGGDLEEYPCTNPDVVAVTLLQSGGVTVNHEGGRWDENARLIAEAVNDLPDVLDELEAARSELAARTTELDARTAERDASRGDLTRLVGAARAVVTAATAIVPTWDGWAIAVMRATGDLAAVLPVSPSPIDQPTPAVDSQGDRTVDSWPASGFWADAHKAAAEVATWPWWKSGQPTPEHLLPTFDEPVRGPAPCVPCRGLGRVVATHDLGCLTLRPCGACGGEGTVPRG